MEYSPLPPMIPISACGKFPLERTLSNGLFDARQNHDYTGKKATGQPSRRYQTLPVPACPSWLHRNSR